MKIVAFMMFVLFAGVVAFLLISYLDGDILQDSPEWVPDIVKEIQPIPTVTPLSTVDEVAVLPQPQSPVEGGAVATATATPPSPPPPPVVEDAPWADGRPEVTDVLYLETDDEPPWGYFVVHFDEPVVVEGVLELSIEAHSYSQEALQEALPMRTREFPARQLRFGPIEAGYFVVAQHLLPGDSTTVRGQSDLDAVLGFEPTGGVLSSTDGMNDVSDIALRGCVFWLQNNGGGIPAHQGLIADVKVARTEQADDGDRQMLRWAERIREETVSPPLSMDRQHGTGACRDLYSQPVGPSNYHKRNESLDRCVNSIALHPRGMKDLSTLMRSRYDELDEADRVLLRQVADTRECRRYYPQMFFDRWVPVTNDSHYRWE